MFISESTAGFLEVSSTVKLCVQYSPSLDCLPLTCVLVIVTFLEMMHL